MKIVLQDGIKDCGVCCLLSVIRYYGGDVSKEQLRDITNTTKDGVTAYNLINGAKQIGFDALGMEGDLSKIDVNNLPCLCHIIVDKNYKHFVVLYSINKNSVTIMDPAKGKKVLKIAEFNLLSSNFFIFLKPLKKLPVICKPFIIKTTIISFIKNNYLVIIVLSLLTLIYFILNILSAFHFKYILEFSINFNTTNNIMFISYNLLIIYFIKCTCSFLRDILLMKILSLFDKELTCKTFEQILLLPYLYYKNRTTGEVITRLKDLNTIKSFLANIICFLLTDFISIIVFSIIMFNINRILTICLFLCSLLLIVINLFKSRISRKLYKNVVRREDDVNSYLIESLSNVDTIKGGHLEKRLIDTFLLKYNSLLDKNYIYKRFISLFNYIKDNINDLVMVIIIGYGCLLVVDDKLLLSELFVFYTLFNYFNSSINNIINLIGEINTFSISYNRIEDLYSINKELFGNSLYYYAYDLKGDILFNNLTYNIGTRCLFNNINLIIKSGSKVLFTGKSGSGKSTLVKMLLRYIEVSFSHISINGIDINHYHLENLRSNITYVSSNEYLFTDTLYENICMHKEVDDELFFKVTDICMVNEIVGDRDIKRVMVEENGINFSNGERQRIILARSLIRHSNIFIFDEALGQIDSYKERIILKNIFRFFKDSTFIVISHKMDNSNLFDKVIRLDDGVINEEKSV